MTQRKSALYARLNEGKPKGSSSQWNTVAHGSKEGASKSSTEIHTHVISALGLLRQEDGWELKASLCLHSRFQFSLDQNVTVSKIMISNKNKQARASLAKALLALKEPCRSLLRLHSEPWQTCTYTCNFRVSKNLPVATTTPPPLVPPNTYWVLRVMTLGRWLASPTKPAAALGLWNTHTPAQTIPRACPSQAWHRKSGGAGSGAAL